MPDPRPRRKIAWKPILGLILIAAALTWLGVLAQPYFSRERMEVLVRGAGAWGPFLLLALQVAQILVAPIPGVFVPILSGLLYGPLVGTAVAAAGTMLGSSAAYWIGRGAGRPLVGRWVGVETLDRAHALIGGKRWIALIPLFLVPLSPSDALCFVSGIVGLRQRHFLLAVILGRLPKDCALALAGAGLLALGGLGAL